MGYHSFPVYGEDIGSAIETVKKIIAKIESNKFDTQDLVELTKANDAIIHALEEHQG